MLQVPIPDTAGLSVDQAWPKLRLFGPMRADWSDGRSFLPRNAKTRAVLAVLALADGKPVPRSLLIGLLWPSRAREQAQASLRQSLHELRGCLKPLLGVGLASFGDGLGLQGCGIWTDAIFAQSPGFLAPHVVDVLRGPLLADLCGLSDAFDAWIFEQRRLVSNRLRCGIEAFLARSEDHHTIVKLAEAVLSFDASHEAAWTALAESCMAAGDMASALEVFHRCASGLRASEVCSDTDVNALLARCLSCSVPQAGISPPRTHGYASSGRREGWSRSVLAVPWRAAYVAVAPTRAIGKASADLAICMDWQIQSALCKFDELSCIPVASGRAGEASPGHLAAEGFDYLLEVCLERANDRDHAIVRLRDLRLKGEVFWSRHITRDAFGGDLLEVDLAASLAPQIATEISKHLAMALETFPGLELSACELVVKASRAIQKLDRDHLSDAARMLSDAIRRDDRHPVLLAWSAYLQLLQVGQGWLPDVDAAQRRIGELIDRGLSLNPQSASVLSIAGHVLAFTQNRLEEGLSLQERALSQNPGLPSAWLFSGLAHTYAGKHKEAISRLQRAKTLSPADQQAYFINMGLSLSYLLDGDALSALHASREAIRLNPNFSSSFKVGVAGSGFTGHRIYENSLLRRLLVLEPALTVERVLSRSPLTQAADKTRLSDGLRLAGLPR